MSDAERILDQLAELRREIVRERERVPSAYVDERAWLSMDDVMRLTGFKRAKVEALVRSGELPMVKVLGSKEYRITRGGFEAFERRVMGDALRPEARHRARYRTAKP